MTSLRLSMLAMSALTACGLSDSIESAGRPYYNAEQQYSIVQPDGWTPSLVRGSTLFSTTSPAHNRHTIIVRAAERPRAMHEDIPATQQELVAATKTALVALRGAKLNSVQALDGAEMPGARFSLSFAPREVRSRYRRESAVLVGSRHIYHVIYTAPASEPIDEKAFASMVSTLTEEGV